MGSETEISVDMLKANWLKRAKMSVEIGDFETANKMADKVLDVDVENADAYVINLLCDYKVKSVEELGASGANYETNNFYKFARRFYNEEQNAKFDARIDAGRGSVEVAHVDVTNVDNNIASTEVIEEAQEDNATDRLAALEAQLEGKKTARNNANKKLTSIIQSTVDRNYELGQKSVKYSLFGAIPLVIFMVISIITGVVGDYPIWATVPGIILLVFLPLCILLGNTLGKKLRNNFKSTLMTYEGFKNNAKLNKSDGMKVINIVITVVFGVIGLVIALVLFICSLAPIAFQVLALFSFLTTLNISSLITTKKCNEVIAAHLPEIEDCHIEFVKADKEYSNMRREIDKLKKEMK